jgi:hypothetical protein
MNCVTFNSALSLALSVAVGATSFAADATKPAAELGTYSRDGGQTYYALSLTPPAAAASQDQPHDIVIVFNTAASMTGPYRETALAALESCVAKLHPQDQVQILAADLEARPLTENFVAAGSAELHAAVEKLRRESPLGATDIDNVLRAAAARFDKARPEGRVLLYVGDGRSPANLMGTDTFRSLVNTLSAGHVAVSSYAVGPQRDGQFLAALANQTGGVMYYDEGMTLPDESQKITDARAKEENLRRGAKIGARMADWVRATVYWPTNAKFPAELGQVFP